MYPQDKLWNCILQINDLNIFYESGIIFILILIIIIFILFILIWRECGLYVYIT